MKLTVIKQHSGIDFFLQDLDAAWKQVLIKEHIKIGPVLELVQTMKKMV